MPSEIGIEGVHRLLTSGAQLVEVLPGGEYEEEHLPNAINLSLKELTVEAADRLLKRDRPVVVYCWDGL